MSGWTVEVLDEAAAELQDWPVEIRAALARIVDRVESVGLSRVGEPMVKHLEGKLWEMRPSGRNVTGRALYVAASGRRVVIVAAFIKKTQRTPGRWLDLAKQRARRVLE